MIKVLKYNGVSRLPNKQEQTRSPLVVTDEFDGLAYLPRVWGSKDVSADGSLISDNQIRMIDGIPGEHILRTS